MLAEPRAQVGDPARGGGEARNGRLDPHRAEFRIGDRRVDAARPQLRVVEQLLGVVDRRGRDARLLEDGQGRVQGALADPVRHDRVDLGRVPQPLLRLGELRVPVSSGRPTARSARIAIVGALPDIASQRPSLVL